MYVNMGQKEWQMFANLICSMYCIKGVITICIRPVRNNSRERLKKTLTTFAFLTTHKNIWAKCTIIDRLIIFFCRFWSETIPNLFNKKDKKDKKEKDELWWYFSWYFYTFVNTKLRMHYNALTFFCLYNHLNTVLHKLLFVLMVLDRYSKLFCDKALFS